MKNIIKKKALFFSILLACHNICMASEDRCSALLRDGVRNSLSEKYDRKFLDEFHSSLCSDKEERISKAKESGIKLGYGDFVADFAGSSKKIASYQESMCSSKDTISSGSNFYQIVNNHVSQELVEGYNQCLKITQGGLDYDISEGKDGDSVTIDVSYSMSHAPKAKLEVTHIVINPITFEKKIDCQGPLAKVRDGNTIEINQTSGVLGITCRPNADFPKSSGQDFSVIIHTNVGHIEGHVTPFHAGKSDRLTELESKFSDISGQLKRMHDGVVGFSSYSCPDGWSVYTPAQGVFIRGLDLSGKIDPDGKRDFATMQIDQFKSHSHPHIHWTNGPSMLPNMVHQKAGGVNTGQPSGNTGETGGVETRPKNVALLFCQKN